MESLKEGKVICKFFRDVILPGDPLLQAAIAGITGVKRCERCKAEFMPKSNRQKYCPDCGVAERRQKGAARNRSFYDRKRAS